MTHPPMHIDELVEHWTILDEERDLIAGKRGVTRLAFAILLKFYTQYGRFPRGRSELPDQVVEHVAKQVQVPASELGFYEWSGSTIEYHRNQIRTHLGFRTCTTADATKVTVWLAENVAHAERRPERVREELFKHLREERIEPPTPGRISRIVASALHNAEVTWSLRISSRLNGETTQRICGLVDFDKERDAGDEEPGDGDQALAGAAPADEDDDFDLLAFIKSAPGNVSLESMMTEIRKLMAVRSIELPPGKRRLQHRDGTAPVRVRGRGRTPGRLVRLRRGPHGSGRAPLLTALRASGSAADPTVGAITLGFWANLRYNDDDPRGALHLVEGALSDHHKITSPRVVAMLHARAARAHSKAGVPADTWHRVDDAFNAYATAPPPDEDLPSMTWITHGELHQVAASSALALGDPHVPWTTSPRR